MVPVAFADGSRGDVKYGAIGEETLLRDLLLWDSLYVSGRLHKPVRFLGGDEAGGLRGPARPLGGGDPGGAGWAAGGAGPAGPAGADWAAGGAPPVSAGALLGPAVEVNRSRALLLAALLMPPGPFSEAELLGRVAGLSYAGDVRAGVAEDPRKVERIVAGSLGALRADYAPHLRQAFEWQLLQPWAGGGAGGGGAPRYILRPGKGVRAKLVECLPPGILLRAARLLGVEARADPSVWGPGPGAWAGSVAGPLLAEMRARSRGAGAELVNEALGAACLGLAAAQRVAAAAVASGRLREVLGAALAGTVRRSSLRQAASGLVASGGVVAGRYVYRKVLKALRR